MSLSHKAHDLRGALSGLPDLGETDGLADRRAVKLFTPDGAGTWFLVEYDPEEMMAYGLCDLGMGFPELGYVSVTELEEVRGNLGLQVEVDLTFDGTLADAYGELRLEVPEWLS